MSPAVESAHDSSILTGMEPAPSAPPRHPENAAFAYDSPSGEPRSALLNASSPVPSSRRETRSIAKNLPVAPVDNAVSARVPGTCEDTACTLPFTDASEPVLPEAQRRWAARPLADRLDPFRKARHWIAAHPEAFAKAISPALARSQADTLVTELLPLLDAIRFLERNAAKLLAPQRLGNKHRPLWLAGVQAEIQRDPLGHVLVIGPSNFPLFLPGVQTVQALVAGNAVTWKPGTGGCKVAQLFAHVLREAGLPRGVLHITDDSVEAGQAALAQSPDKVVFTGSFNTGQRILRGLADTLTPATLELSGADAVVVLPSADPSVVAKAITFGLRLNGAEVCMSPRRLVATRETLNALRPLLQAALADVPAVPLKPNTSSLLQKLLAEAGTQGASVLPLGEGASGVSATAPLFPGDLSLPAQATSIRPLLINNATSSMAITRTDVFAPVLSLLEAPSVLHLADLVNSNPYGLTAAVFGNPREAQSLARQLRVGTVLINDLIAPTADPRIPFGGRGHSGYGVTRGAQGLLEMTATKSVLVRRKGSTRHYEPTGARELPLFAGLLGVLHAGTLRDRLNALKRLVTASRSSPA